MLSFRIRHIFSLLFLLCLSLNALGQDLIARQAPIDRKMRAVDSVALYKALQKVSFTNYESNDLYPSWITNKVHCYKGVSIPETYKIDLRGFCMPTKSRLVTSGFGYRPAFRRKHKGLDIKVYTGDTIVAAFDGKVRIVDYEAAGYGYYVVIRHKNGLETFYAHLSKQLVSIGEVVKAGQVIGLGGNTGLSSGSHLHFETRFLGVALNPALLFDFANQDVTGDYFVYNDAEHNDDSPLHLAARLEKETAHASHEGEGATVARAEANLQGKFHQVRRGENLSSIADKLGLTVQNLCSFNGVTPTTRLRVGQILRY